MFTHCVKYHKLYILQNLPFSVENKWRLLASMVLFFGSGFAFPFIVVRHQILKKWSSYQTFTVRYLFKSNFNYWNHFAFTVSDFTLFFFYSTALIFFRRGSCNVVVNKVTDYINTFFLFSSFQKRGPHPHKGRAFPSQSFFL